MIRSTVAKNLQGSLQKSGFAYAAFKFLFEMFDSLESHYLVKLHNRFQSLPFCPGYNLIRLIPNFDYIEEYALHGNTFSPQYVLTLFLQKIDGIYDPSFQPNYNFFPWSLL